ncbi:MAG: hypothetical protein JW701_03785, partial [Kosmotogaceae bacterium]|nr:hypothetical protein [Kosmotogaceae bacterium]
GSNIYLLTPGGKMSGLASFSRYVREPASTKDGFVAAGQLQGNKLLQASEVKPDDFELDASEINSRSAEPVVGSKYDGFANWMFISPIPYKGLSLLFSDLTFHNKLIAGGSFDFETMQPGLHIELFSDDYAPVDFALSIAFFDFIPEASLDAYRQYKINPKLSFGWRTRFEYPLRVSGSVNAILRDSSALYGGQASLETLINIRDTQTATTNLVDVGINVDFDWKKGGLIIDSTIFSRVTFGVDPSIVPVEMWEFRDTSNIVVGLSSSSDYAFSRRGINFLNLAHLSEEGIGGRIDLLIGSRFSWRLAIYKFETVYLYSAYPLAIRMGVMLENMRLLPYFDLRLLY